MLAVQNHWRVSFLALVDDIVIIEVDETLLVGNSLHSLIY